MSSINLTDYDLVFIVKLFSTLKRQGADKEFLGILKNAICTTLKPEGVIVFIDINNQSEGRDEFHTSVLPLFHKVDKYRFRGYGWYWKLINKKKIVFEIPSGLPFDPLMKIGKTICFEYRDRK
jgi:hypothetical protein